MSYFYHKISVIISGLLSMLLIINTNGSIPLDKVNNSNSNTSEIIESEIVTSDDIEESDQTELPTENEEHNSKKDNDSNDTINNDSKTKVKNNDVSKNITSTTPNNNTNVNEKEINVSEKQNNINESANIQPKQEEPKKYIGVADPNNFNYSFHNGKVEYSDYGSCTADAEIIEDKDTIDIINSWCVDVRDSNNTILGYYLYIKCSSGNCNKYKN